MRRCKWALGLAGVAAAVLLGSLNFGHSYRFAGESRLNGRLSRIGFQLDCWGLAVPPTSEWRDKWLWTEDPVFLPRVESWLQGLKPPPACEGAFRQRGGRIIMVFQDGRQEEFLFRGPDRPGPSAERCHGFRWNGHQLSYRDEPFSDFLGAVGPRRKAE